MAIEHATGTPAACGPADSSSGYPALFRDYVLNGVETALAACRASGPIVPDELRERSLHALSFALKLPDCWTQARDLLVALAPTMEIHGVRDEWMDYLRKGNELAQATGDWTTQAQVQLSLGRLSLIVGEHALAEEQLGHALRCAEHDGAPRLAARIMERLAYCAALRSDFAQARQTAQAVLDILHGEPHECAPIYHTLGYVALSEGKWQSALEHFNAALAGRGPEPSLIFEARGLCDCGMALKGLGEHAVAAEHMREAVRLFGLAGDWFNQATARMNLGIAYHAMGKYDESLECYRQCEPMFVKADSSAQMARLYHHRADALRDVGHLSSNYAQARPGADASAIQPGALASLEMLPERPAYVHQEMVRKINEVTYPYELYRTESAAA